METLPTQPVELKLEGKEKDFYNYHGIQLFGASFPASVSLITQLHEKLDKCLFDAGDYFEIIVNEETESFEVRAKKDIPANQDVFLVDHAFSFRYPELRTALTQNQQLRERISSMLTFANTKKTHPQYPKKSQNNANIPIHEFDNQEIEDPSTVEVPEDAVGVSFWGNDISDFQKLKGALDRLPNVKVLWLNGNPIAEDFEKLRQWIEENYKNIQILNSQFTHSVNAWGIKFANMYPNLQGFETVEVAKIRHLDLSSRNIFHLEDFTVFSEFKRVKSFNVKSHEMATFDDTNKLFALMKLIPKLKNIDCEGQIYDVLWELQKNNKLKDVCPTLESINNYGLLEGKPKDEENDILNSLKNIWKLAGTYRLATSEQLDETSIWYVMDEFGCGIQHSEDFNCMLKPFLYAPNNKLDADVISYSILWLTKDVKAGDQILRDYLQGVDESKGRLAKSKVWYDLPEEMFIEAFRKREEKLEKTSQEAKEKLKQIAEAHPEKAHQAEIDTTHPLKVATDYELLVNKLTSKSFEIVKGFDEAHILWMVASLEDNSPFAQGKFTNQFPGEVCIVMKHFLAQTVNDGVGKVKWLQPTYNLSTELNEFIGEFTNRDKNHHDNHWIIKAPNLARSLDMVVTDNLDAIIRLTETNPRIAQKYIQRPLTFRNKKIDHRFLVVVRSIKPLEVFIYKTFMTRTANNKFTLDPRSVDNYETHFTIMVYSGRKQDVLDMDYFIETFDQENKPRGVTWDDAYQKVKEMVKEIFTTVELTHPEMHSKYSRAIYGMDVMFDKDYQPKLLELTFSPDCKRVCECSPSFFNDVFECLFLNKEQNLDRVL